MRKKPGPFEVKLNRSGLATTGAVQETAASMVVGAHSKLPVRRVIADSSQLVANAGSGDPHPRKPHFPQNPYLRVLSEKKSAADLIPSPCREFDCANYESCLSLAAALDWDSFSCANCNGRMNSQLLWRAHHRLKFDDELARLCDLPPLSPHHKTQSEGPEEVVPIITLSIEKP